MTIKLGWMLREAKKKLNGYPNEVNLFQGIVGQLNELFSI